MISTESIYYFSEFSDPGYHSGYTELVFTYTVIVVCNFKYLDAVVKTEIFHPDPTQLWGAGGAVSRLFQQSALSGCVSASERNFTPPGAAIIL